MNKKITYTCDYCEKEYDKESDCLACEISCKLADPVERLQTTFSKLFPSRYAKNDKYHLHCVKCGKLLVSYKPEFDGHRNERGTETRHEVVYRMFDGRYCFNCHQIVKQNVMVTLCMYYKP